MAETLAKSLVRQVAGGYLPAGMWPSGQMTSRKRSPMERINDLLAANWYGDNREGYQKASRLTNVAQTLAPPIAAAETMYDAGGEAGRGNYGAAGITLGMAGLPMPPALKKKIRAYHGSPHSFDKFSMDKIGTGEGAQAYGHGLYFAEGEGVAKSYKDVLSGRVNNPARNKRLGELAKEMQKYEIPGRYGEYKDPKGYELKAEYDRIMDERAADKGHMYEVEIDADPNQFLDWDKPLSEQPEIAKKIGVDYQDVSGIKARIAEINTHRPFQDTPEHTALFEEYADLLGKMDADPRGSTVYSRIAKDAVPAQDLRTGFDAFSPYNAAKVLKEKGVPGIKYLDAGSRNQGDGPYWNVIRKSDGVTVSQVATKERAAELAASGDFHLDGPIDNRSRNYVVFDEKLISIVRKYGIAGASAVLGYDVLSEVTPAQASTLKALAPPKVPLIDIDKRASQRRKYRGNK